MRFNFAFSFSSGTMSQSPQSQDSGGSDLDLDPTDIKHFPFSHGKKCVGEGLKGKTGLTGLVKSTLM